MKPSNIHLEKIIKNINIPACKNCFNFKPTELDGLFVKNDICNKFGSKDIITNKIKYDYAYYCRKNELKCGEEGKYFQQEKYVKLKILKYKIIGILPITPIVLIPTGILVIIANINSI